MDKIPVIAGMNAERFESFWDSVKKDDKGNPLSGSMGVSWSFHKDLVPTATMLNNDRSAMIAAITAGLGSQTNARQLVDCYLFFQNKDQPYFFIRQGKKLLALVKKTSGYKYDYQPEKTNWYPHRVEFTFVRQCTEGEVARFKRGIQTIEYLVPDAIDTETRKKALIEDIERKVMSLQQLQETFNSLIKNLEELKSL
jgi:hypothetical protein